MVCLAIVSFVSNAKASPTEEPMKSFSVKIDKVIEILKAQKGNKIDKEAAKKEIWDIVHGVFDFKTISIRTVGRAWKDFSEQEQKDFIDAFSELLGTSYLNKIDKYNNETLTYLSQELVDGNKAVIKVAVIRQSGNVPLDYNLLKKGSEWFIYDVKVEGISLVKNYRTQFASFLSKKTPADLIKRLRDKNNEIKKSGKPADESKEEL